jgi:GMP synthase (glutamine-hydrolysing)
MTGKKTQRQAIDLGKPFLGVCYGHQSLVRSLGGRQLMRRSHEAEYGWTRIETTGPSALFSGLPSAFYSFSAHQEEVASLPNGMKLLARSERCGIQACELEGKPVFGIQFHPEKTAEEGEESLAKRKAADCLHRGQGSRLFDSRVGQTIFGNFLSL